MEAFNIESPEGGMKAVLYKYRYYTCGVVFFYICVFTFGIHAAVIYDNGKKYSTNDCPTLELCRNCEITLTNKWYDLWHYTFTTGDISIEQVCPSANRDVKIYTYGTLYSRSDKKTFTTVSTNYINNCQGDTKYIVQTADIWKTISNLNGITASLLITDPNNNYLAYVQGTGFFNYDFDIIDYKTGLTIAHMTREFLSIPEKWNINIYNNSSPALKSEVLYTIAARQSFIDEDDSDICNQYFWGASITVLTIMCLTACGVCVILFFILKKMKYAIYPNSSTH